MVQMQVRREPRFVYLCDAPPRGDRLDRSAFSYGWRLDAANHRALARAVSVVGSAEACRAAATEMRERIGDARLVVGSDVLGGLWSWQLDLDGVLVAISPHTFARRVECARAYRQFLAALALADPSCGVIRNLGPRTLRGFRVRTVAP